jgi:hypothetical protein
MKKISEKAFMPIDQEENNLMGYSLLLVFCHPRSILLKLHPYWSYT